MRTRLGGYDTRPAPCIWNRHGPFTSVALPSVLCQHGEVRPVVYGEHPAAARQFPANLTEALVVAVEVGVVRNGCGSAVPCAVLFHLVGSHGREHGQQVSPVVTDVVCVMAYGSGHLPCQRYFPVPVLELIGYAPILIRGLCHAHTACDPASGVCDGGGYCIA